MKPRGDRLEIRPGLYADDHLLPGERAYYGDEVAMDVAQERYIEATVRHRASDIDPEADLLGVRPDDVDPNRSDADSTEVGAWRQAVLAGHPMAWRADDEGSTR